jgi:hypothetical protein
MIINEPRKKIVLSSGVWKAESQEQRSIGKFTAITIFNNGSFCMFDTLGKIHPGQMEHFDYKLTFSFSIGTILDSCDDDYVAEP